MLSAAVIILPSVKTLKFSESAHIDGLTSAAQADADETVRLFDALGYKMRYEKKKSRRMRADDRMSSAGVGFADVARH